MKNIIGLFIVVVAAIAFVSCEPIENRQTMKGAVTEADIAQYVTVTPEIRNGKRSNWILCKSDGLKALTSFSYSMGTYVGTSHRLQVLEDGDHTFTLTVLNADGTKLTKNYTVNVEELYDLREEWTWLCGFGTPSGSRTWVFDGEGGDDRVWWAMSDPGNPNGIWWNAGGECCPPSDVNGRMVFEFKGLVLTTYASPTDANPKKGTFAFNGDFTELTTNGDANILGSEEGGGNNRVFKVVELTNNALFLFVPNAAWDTGWIWKFKTQE